jgi:hypothetical protein
MKFSHPHRHRQSGAGFTLIEMMTSVGLGLVLLTGVAILYINGNECFVAMANYQNLDKYSCNAMDLLSKEIRGASAVTATNATSITFANGANTFSVTYNSGPSTLVLSDVSGSQIYTDTGQSSVTNLAGCVLWSYSLFGGAPNPAITSNIVFFAADSLPAVKVVQMNWKCQRTYVGKAINTESVQTAQIVLRNNTYN